jgi:hypothetical protein
MQMHVTKSFDSCIIVLPQRCFQFISRKDNVSKSRLKEEKCSSHSHMGDTQEPQDNGETPALRNTETSLASGSRTDLEQDLTTLIDSTGVRLLANIVINSGIRILHLKDTVGATLAVTTILSVLIYLATTLLGRVFDRSAPLLIFPSAVASFITALSFGIIKTLHDNILPPNAKNLVSLALDEKGLVLLRDWFRSFLSLPKQLITSLLLGGLSVPSSLMIARNTSVSLDVGAYVLIFFCMFSVGHGFYCAVLIPTLAKAGSTERMRLFWLSPADSPGIKMASLAFAKLSVADAAVVTICIIMMYWFRPWESPIAALISGIWLLLGLTAVSYSFLYPHYHLSKAIKAEKNRQMAGLQGIITSYRKHLENLGEDDFEKLSELVKLYEQLAAARETAIDMRALRRFLTSLVIPTLSFFGGLFDLDTLINLGKSFGSP